MNKSYSTNDEAQERVRLLLDRMASKMCPLARVDCHEDCAFLVGGWVDKVVCKEGNVHVVEPPKCLVEELLRHYTGINTGKSYW